MDTLKRGSLEIEPIKLETGRLFESVHEKKDSWWDVKKQIKQNKKNCSWDYDNKNKKNLLLI